MIFAAYAVFCLSAGLLLWTYFLYPAFIVLAARLRGKPFKRAVFDGRVSMVVAAHNEEAVIRRKILNCLELDFGPAESEIIAVSDGSTDETERILGEMAGLSERLRVMAYRQRAGKGNALNLAAGESTGDVLIFTDANVFLDKDAPCRLLEPFADPHVGAVCGRVAVRCQGEEIAGESLYMRFEGVVQRAEGTFQTVIGVDGALFAMRRELFRPLEKETILDDFSLSMEAPLAGLRIVYSDARGVEEAVASASNEFRRKARIAAGGWQYLSRLYRKSGRLGVKVWFMLFSHKILRWLSPVLMVMLFAGNIPLSGRPAFALALCGQSAFYLLAAQAFFFPQLRRFHVFYVPYYFCVINLAALVGGGRFVSGRQKTTWEKVQRKSFS